MDQSTLVARGAAPPSRPPPNRPRRAAGPASWVLLGLLLVGCGDSPLPPPDQAPPPSDDAAMGGDDLTLPPPPDLAAPSPDLTALDGRLGDDLSAPPDVAMAPIDLAVPPPDLAAAAPDLAKRSCVDGLANGDETDVDCGGLTCPACAVGKACQKLADCASRVCANNRCAPPALTFAAVVSYPFASSTQLTVADLNGDGKADIAATAPGRGVGVLLGAGDGSFGNALFSPAGDRARGVAAADFDGDKKLDLAIGVQDNTNGDGLVQILVGLGDGRFAQPLGFAAVQNPGTIGVALADFNGDGRVDVAAGGATQASSLSVFFGKGNGALLQSFTYKTGAAPNYLVAGDWNRDGRIDIATSDQGSNSLTVLIGQNNGGFQATKSYMLNLSPYEIVAGDWNLDGSLDLATAAGSGVSVLLGRGDGTFGGPTAFPAGATTNAVTTADFNGDGKPDLACAVQANAVALLLGVGDGSFGAAMNLAVASPQFAVAKDLNRDGKPDLAVTGNNAVAILLNSSL